MTKRFLAWAIDLNTDEGHGLTGRYFFGSPIPEHMEGCVTALFRTRDSARKALCRVREGNTFPNARARRVQVTITTKGVT